MDSTQSAARSVGELRDYFAGQALAGLAVALTDKQIMDLAEGIVGGRFVAGAAYTLADAMLAKRAFAEVV